MDNWPEVMGHIQLKVALHVLFFIYIEREKKTPRDSSQECAKKSFGRKAHSWLFYPWMFLSISMETKKSEEQLSFECENSALLKSETSHSGHFSTSKYTPLDNDRKNTTI